MRKPEISLPCKAASVAEMALYVHIPYCDSKCPYCDFNSHAAKVWPEERYVTALEREMEVASSEAPWRGASIATVFFGGGTPSLFDPRSIARLIAAINRRWRVYDDAEISLEANPGTVDAFKLDGFRDAGVNRLSFGVQSFDDSILTALGRIHDSAAAMQAVCDAQDAGFENINVDLMFAIPGQSIAQWESDLMRAVDLGTTHVSAYNLTFEEGTVFHAMRQRGRLTQEDESTEIAMYESAERILEGAGLQRYEVSNYALPGCDCRHNLAYWRAKPYLGVGAGAHSFAPQPPPARRWSNTLAPVAYMDEVLELGHARADEEIVDECMARGEFAFLALRCRDGISEAEFTRRFGMGVAEAFPQCLAMKEEGLLEQTETHWRLSRRSWMIADEIFATFV